ncbi:DUF134 domain-containing protein [Ancylomarina salipaludis]|uniref:UPF0251 protein EO244_07080 n=1 Tax=Ancylomarina salipaludis TaxID=2501299 RepID=A0A4Q1JM43_9BACT|nr:DUF134 domain-containing protein [Ancylomarina salipaludis]RXQ95619.1 DUF134 domain-containing protein [Ancylomarina salipaludis]
MARPRNNSKIQIPPRVKGFNPQGYYANPSEEVKLNIEEFEVIRLLDYENLSQLEASKIMEISRPSLTRIYDRARKKIAQALIEASPIRIEGGKIVYDETWYECLNCRSHFNKTGDNDVKRCPLCSSVEILKVEGEL